MGTAESRDIADPIVEEARAAGQQYIDSFHGNWKAIMADLQRRSDAAGRHVVTHPPVVVAPAKKVG